MAAEPFEWQRQGRNPVTMYTVLAVWAALIALVVMVQAAPWLMGAVALFTLPACWDLYRNPASGLRIDADQLTWYSGRRRATLDWSEVARVRFDTRLDFSVRATVLLTGGRKVRLPYESTPPDKLMEAALNAHGIRTERHHFSLIG